jgi:hypothetical protein
MIQNPGQGMLMYALFPLLKKWDNQGTMTSRRKKTMETAYYLAIALVVTITVGI